MTKGFTRLIINSMHLLSAKDRRGIVSATLSSLDSYSKHEIIEKEFYQYDANDGVYLEICVACERSVVEVERRERDTDLYCCENCCSKYCDGCSNGNDELCPFCDPDNTLFEHHT